MKESNPCLKFRMWNENLKKMSYFDNPHFHLSTETSDNGRKSMKHYFAFSLAENNDLYFGTYKMVMQGLPLYDRNGKQAYEDDIIEFSNTEGRLYRKKIIWDDKLLCYSIGTIPYKDLYNSGFIQPSKLVFEIIGNVYENPDLLGGKNAIE